jgi:hypothetical protein
LSARERLNTWVPSARGAGGAPTARVVEAARGASAVPSRVMVTESTTTDVVASE